MFIFEEEVERKSFRLDFVMGKNIKKIEIIKGVITIQIIGRHALYNDRITLKIFKVNVQNKVHFSMIFHAEKE